MNEIIKSLHSRKSVRVYENREIGESEKKAILSAALEAPSAGNMCLYTILDITDPALKEALSHTCDEQPFIKDAPMVLVFCADYKRWYDVFCESCEKVRKPDTGDLFLAQADTIIAAQNAVVAAESLGIGSCYIGDIVENIEEQQKLLNLPQYVVPAAMLCFGYPTKQQKERKKPARFNIEDVVHENGYSKDKASRMKDMLKNREQNDDIDGWLKRFCERKWNSDFSREMSRSCNEIINSWKK